MQFHAIQLQQCERWLQKKLKTVRGVLPIRRWQGTPTTLLYKTPPPGYSNFIFICHCSFVILVYRKFCVVALNLLAIIRINFRLLYSHVRGISEQMGRIFDWNPFCFLLFAHLVIEQFSVPVEKIRTKLSFVQFG